MSLLSLYTIRTSVGPAEQPVRSPEWEYLIARSVGRESPRSHLAGADFTDESFERACMTPASTKSASNRRSGVAPGVTPKQIRRSELLPKRLIRLVGRGGLEPPTR